REAAEVVYDVEAPRPSEKPRRQRRGIAEVAPPRPLAFSSERLDRAVRLRSRRGPEWDFVTGPRQARRPISDDPPHAPVTRRRTANEGIHAEQDPHDSASRTMAHSRSRSSL